MLYGLIGAVIAALIFLAAAIFVAIKNARLERKIEEYENECNKHQEDILKLEKEKSSLEKEIEMIKKSEKIVKEVFENVANEILEKTTQKAQDEIGKILDPLEDSILEFKNQINELYINESKTIGELFNELKNLKELNKTLSEEAKLLANALTTQSKTQGMWGEMILDKILELSGLREGFEYKKEVVFKIDGKIYRADVVVFLPDNKKLIIDAKTSLKDYIEYVNTKDEEALKRHIKSIKNHINELISKDYEKFKNSIDFIFMFIPNDNALNVALEKDFSIYEEAFKHKIILTSPSTLLPALRAVDSIWRLQRQNENIKEVIRKVEILYDKVRIFIEEYEKLGKSINNAKEMYDKSSKRLKEMIIFQIEDIKKTSGIKPKRSIT
ncbi:DNA recombination protein RmuC [Caminibacter sp.]